MSLFDKLKSVPFNKDEKGAVMSDNLDPKELSPPIKYPIEENYDQFFSPEEIEILDKEGFSRKALRDLYAHCVDK